MKNFFNLILNHWEKMLCVTTVFVAIIVLALGWLGVQKEARVHENSKTLMPGKKTIPIEPHDAAPKLAKLDKPYDWSWKADSARLFSPNFVAKVAMVNGLPRLQATLINPPPGSGTDSGNPKGEGQKKHLFKTVEDGLLIADMKNEPFKLRFKGEQVIGDKKSYQINFLSENRTKIAPLDAVIDGFKLMTYRLKIDKNGKDTSELDVQKEGGSIITLIYNQDVYAGDEAVVFMKNRTLPNLSLASTAYMYRKGNKLVVVTDVEQPDKTITKLNVEVEIKNINLETHTVTLPETGPPNTTHKITWAKFDKKPEEIKETK